MARNVADFMTEIFNGVGGVSGVNQRLDNKLDKTANAVSASKLQTARSIKVSLASNSAANFDGSANVTVGVDGVLPASHGGTGVSNLQNLNVGFATTASVAATSNFATRADQDCDGNKISTTYLKAGGTVASANKLATSRTFQTNLASTTAASFDGTANNSHGVTGTLGVANGGTGQTSLANVTVGAASKATLDGAGNNIANTYLKSTGTAASATKLANSRTFQTNLASTVAAGFDGTANNSHGVTGTLPVANGGTGQTSLANVTVGAASKATLDGSGNNIASTYAKKSDIPDAVDLTKVSGNIQWDGTNNYITSDWAGLTMKANDGNVRLQADNGNVNLYGNGTDASGRPGHVTLTGKIVLYSHTIYVDFVEESSPKYEFKSDGIYLNGTKITN